MSKNNIAQQYNSMVASIEDAKIYDGRENAEILRNCSLQGKYVELNNDK